MEKYLLFFIEIVVACIPIFAWDLNKTNYDYLRMADKVIQISNNDLEMSQNYTRPDVQIYKEEDENYYIELYQSESFVYFSKNGHQWRHMNPYNSDRERIYREIQSQYLVWHQNGVRID